jgi:hypothetical protein
MVIKHYMLANIFFLSISTLFISCSNEFKDFDEFIKNSVFNDNEILDEKIYEIQDTDNKARIIYSGSGTHFGIYENPDGKILFHLKYRTEIVPIEIISSNGIIWVKVETNDNRIGWIKSHFIEIKRVNKLKTKGSATVASTGLIKTRQAQ